jgi:hypothetical protein
MSNRPSEITVVHSRILKSALELDESRAYWARSSGLAAITPKLAFDEFWFGARGMERIENLLFNFKHRYDAFPDAKAVLSRWLEMPPLTRRLVCHWHLQLADPTYRVFSGEYLPARVAEGRPEVTRDLIVRWMADRSDGRWSAPTLVQFASKLLSAAYAAGLVGTTRDPRPIVSVRVSDEALTYILYLLRETDFAGTILENPYLASVGLEGAILEERLRRLPALEYRRMGDVVEFGWRYTNLVAWSDAMLMSGQLREGASI